MASKRRLLLGGYQPQRQFFGSRRLVYFLVACLSAFLVIVSPPVFAYISSEVPVSQGIAAPNQLVQQGREHYEAGQFAAAAQVWQQAAQASQSQGDSLNQAMVLSNLALAHQQLGQWTEAKKAIATSLELLQSEPETLDRRRIFAQALNTQGHLQMAQGQAQQALTTLQQAADAYKQVGDEAGVIRCAINRAQILRVQGLYRRSLSLLNQANQTLQGQSDSSLKATGLRHLGNSLKLVGELNKSKEVLQQSLEVAEKLASPPDIASALLSLGNTARTQADTEAALTFYQKSAAIASSPTTRIQAQVNQLSLLVESGSLSRAEPLLPEIEAQLADLPLSRIAVASRINFAQSLMKLGAENAGKQELNPNIQKIAKILAIAVQQASSLGDKHAQAYALGSLGSLYEKNQQWSEAQELTQQALFLAQSINAPDITYRWQWQLGRLLKAQGDEKGVISERLDYHEASIVAYTEAVKTLQSLRSDLVAINSEVQFSFREGVEPVYRELVELLLSVGGTETNSRNLEKARKVIESLQVAELDNFLQAACLTAKAVQIDGIDQKAAVIYPIILRDRLEVILSLPHKPLRHYATDLTSDQVESITEQLRVALNKPFGWSFLPLSQQVYDLLIRPAEADLQASEVKTLVFVLDGPLRSIPMAALHDGKQYLVEKYGIALAPGLELIEPQPLARGKLKILTAGLSEARPGFPALPGVEVELKKINSQIPGEVLLNQEFNTLNIQNAIDDLPIPVVHLATHGQFSSKAEDTFILTWDGPINVNELNNLLQTTGQHQSRPIELLVLSACETAKGDSRAALGIAGVAMRAGARSTLATLWSVNDAATATLMVRFYQELANETITKAEALRRAQLSILQNLKYRQQPYYWAPFVLVGNWL
jgi:CHAT domain-containing protein